MLEYYFQQQYSIMIAHIFLNTHPVLKLNKGVLRLPYSLNIQKL